MAQIDPSKIDTHKLKTPLTAIFGYIQLLQASKNLTDSQKRWLEELINETKRLLHMIEELKTVELEEK